MHKLIIYISLAIITTLLACNNQPDPPTIGEEDPFIVQDPITIEDHLGVYDAEIRYTRYTLSGNNADTTYKSTITLKKEDENILIFIPRRGNSEAFEKDTLRNDVLSYNYSYGSEKGDFNLNIKTDSIIGSVGTYYNGGSIVYRFRSLKQ